MFVPLRASAVLTLALGLMPVAGCSSDSEPAAQPAAEHPRVLSATFVESPEAPLAGTLTVRLDRAASLAVLASDPRGHRLELTSPPAVEHVLPLLGLRAARTYALSVTAVADGLLSEPKLLERRTPALPADFPPLRVAASQPNRAGLTLFPVSRIGPAGVDRWGYLVAVDAAGEVVWYVNALSTVADVQRGARGQIRYMFDERGIAEITPLGKVERALLAQGPARDADTTGFLPVALDTLHHDVVELPNGHWLSLSTETRALGPTQCPSYDKTYDVIGDLVVELDPTSGAVLRKVSLFDLLDPCRRVDVSFKSNFWGYLYGASGADWTHANSVFFDAASNTALVSLRHQDWVLGVTWGAAASTLAFKFGPEGDFPLEGAGALYPYHQHAARILPDGHLSLFDNGTTRPGTNDGDLTRLPSSRAVEYELARSGPKSSWKATQVWQHGEGEVRLVDPTSSKPIGWYSPVVGDSVHTAEGTVLITEGAVMSPAAGFLLDMTIKKSARIVEVERKGAASVVFDLRVEDPAAAGFESYLVYRATRIPTLYPPGAVTAKVSIP